MKKRSLISLFFSLGLLAGCSATKTIITKEKANPDIDYTEGVNLNPQITKGPLGDFELVSPMQDAVCDKVPTFSWTASENAINYTLEVCSSESFYTQSSSIVYAKETNINALSFKISADLVLKNNQTYYWRVTAVNQYNPRSVGKEKMSEVSSFIYNVESEGEVDIGVGEAEDWALHKGGSVADISIDHSDFFGTGNQDTLRITFDKEHTLNGQTNVENSRGWIVVQKAVEKDFFGTTGLYCDFYYMGHDSTILLRIIDQDGELWYKQVNFTMDVKQIALLKWSDFILRRGDTVVQNETFDYQHIQAIEVCFERTFGDGCCMIGGIKAVEYEDYAPLFIEKLNYNIIPLSDWIYESYNFATTISEDGYELRLDYSPLNGYGFAKIPVKRYFTQGNAIRVKIKFSGGYNANQTNAILRIYEPDQDRWSMTMPFKQLVKDEYTELTIPYAAFEQSSIVEGKRQFYYIENIQFGLNNCYNTGSIFYKDFEIITTPSVSENKREVGQDGVIENFDNYSTRLNAYESWECSVENKDEGIFLNSDEMFHDGTNVNAGRFTYKTDMQMASYDIYTDVKAQGLNAIKFWIKDASVPKTEGTPFSDYTGDDVAPLVVIQIALNDGRWYRYQIDKAPRKWTEYVIPFSEFYLFQGSEYEDSPAAISENVVNFAFGMQYFYMYNGKGYPLYTQNNPVFMDNIMFTSATSMSEVALENELHPDANKVTLVDNFEYESDEALHNKWFGISKDHLEYEHIELSNDVSSEGGTHSMKLDYKGSTSPSYAVYPTIGSDSESRCLSVDIKGDGIATVYLNIYLRGGNNTLVQYRYIINKAANGWNRYVIGFSDEIWTNMTNSQSIGTKSLQMIQRFTFGVAGGSGESVASIYVDNLKFCYNPGFGVNTVTPLD